MALNLIKSAWEAGELVFRNRTSGAEVAAVTTDGMRVSDLNMTSLAQLRFGAAEACTIVSGVLTVTSSYVRVTSESSTADQVDTITKAGVAEGDILVLIPTDGHTITVDDANIDLGAATRAVAPGGALILHYNGTATSWQELTFLAAADNA